MTTTRRFGKVLSPDVDEPSWIGAGSPAIPGGLSSARPLARKAVLVVAIAVAGLPFWFLAGMVLFESWIQLAEEQLR